MAFSQIGTNTWYIEFDFGDIPNDNIVNTSWVNWSLSEKERDREISIKMSLSFWNIRVILF